MPGLLLTDCRSGISRVIFLTIYVFMHDLFLPFASFYSFLSLFFLSFLKQTIDQSAEAAVSGYVTETTEIYFSKFWRLESSRSRCQQIWFQMRLSSWLTKLFFSPYPHMAETDRVKQRGYTVVSPVRTLILQDEDPTLWPNNLNFLLIDPIPELHTWALNLQHRDFGKDTGQSRLN